MVRWQQVGCQPAAQSIGRAQSWAMLRQHFGPFSGAIAVGGRGTTGCIKCRCTNG